MANSGIEAATSVRGSPAQERPQHATLSIEFKVEFVCLADFPDLREFHVVEAFGASSRTVDTFCRLYGDYVDLERIGQADLLIVCSDDLPGMRSAAVSMRSARLICPIVAAVRDASVSERAQLLEAGFDDVFDNSLLAEEVVARSNALCRRARVYDRRNALDTARLRSQRSLNVSRPVFSARESRIVTLLQENGGKVVPYRDILAAIDGDDSHQALHTLQVVISGIRHKIPDDWEILSVNKRGYMMSLKPGNDSEQGQSPASELFAARHGRG